MEFQQQVLVLIKEKALFKPGDKLIIGVSGGADSIALAHVLAQLRPATGIQIHLAHYNHKTRKAADRDQRFVEDFAKNLELPLTVEVRGGKLLDGTLSEDKARQLRFNFFLRLVKKHNAQAVVLAHHQDDLAETVLMRLIRGAGLLGLRGILPDTSIKGVRFIRPLIDVNRVQIEHYLRQHKLRFCVDKTNRRPIFLRNKIRLQLLPLLGQEYNPNITKVLLDIANTAQEDYDFLLLQAQKCFKENVVRRSSTVKIALSKLLPLHPAMQRLLIRLMVEDLTADPSALAFAHMQELELLLQKRSSGAVVHLSKKLKAKKTLTYFQIYL